MNQHVVTVDVADPQRHVEKGQNSWTPEVNIDPTGLLEEPINLLDLASVEDGAKEDDDAPKKNSEQFFLKLGSLVSLLGGCLNTSTSMMDAFNTNQWQLGLVNAILLGVLQGPTTVALFYSFLKDWIKRKLSAFRKAMKELKIMEEMYNASHKNTANTTYEIGINTDLSFQEVVEMHNVNRNGLLTTNPMASRHLSPEDMVSYQAENLAYQAAEPIVLRTLEHRTQKDAPIRKHTKSNGKNRKRGRKEKITKGNEFQSSVENGNVSTNNSSDLQKSSKGQAERSELLQHNPNQRDQSKSNTNRSNDTLLDETTFETSRPKAGKNSKKKLHSCFPFNLVKSKSLPNVSQEDFSSTNLDEDLTTHVSGHNKRLKERQSIIKFPWKNRRAASMDRLSLDLSDNTQRLEVERNQAKHELKSKPPYHGNQTASCFPLFCGRGDVSLVSSDTEMEDINAIEHPTKRQGGRLLPIIRSNVSDSRNESAAPLDTSVKTVDKQIKGKAPSYGSINLASIDNVDVMNKAGSSVQREPFDSQSSARRDTTRKPRSRHIDRLGHASSTQRDNISDNSGLVPTGSFEGQESTRRDASRTKRRKQREAFDNHNSNQSMGREDSDNHTSNRSMQRDASDNHIPNRSMQRDASDNHIPNRSMQRDASDNHTPNRPKQRDASDNHTKQRHAVNKHSSMPNG